MNLIGEYFSFSPDTQISIQHPNHQGLIPSPSILGEHRYRRGSLLSENFLNPRRLALSELTSVLCMMFFLLSLHSIPRIVRFTLTHPTPPNVHFLSYPLLEETLRNYEFFV